jgi:hypothetical protein
MAVLMARDAAQLPNVVSIAEAQAGNGVTTHVADRGSSHKVGGTMIRVIAAAGATPTCTYLIEVSTDGSTWGAATYADAATPTTDTTATFNTTVDSVLRKIIKHPTMWRYIRVTMSANTNVVNTVDVLFNDEKSFLSS